MIKKLIWIFVISGVLFYTGIAGKVFNDPKVKKVFSGSIRVVTSMLKAGVDAGLKESGMDDPTNRTQAIKIIKDTLIEGGKEVVKAAEEGFKEGLAE